MGKLILDSQLEGVLKNPSPGPRNHFIADCPLCSKEGHFYINRDTQLWDCKKCKEAGNIFQLLKSIGKLHLLDEGRQVDFEKPLENKIKMFLEDIEVTEEDLKIEKIRLPIGYKKVTSDQYLQSRGFLKEDFIRYEVGVTSLKKKYRDYIIIPVFEEGEVVGYLARSKKSKEEIELINSKYKQQGLKKKHLRWQNSTKANFSKLLYGIDEVVDVTHTVILVESFFGKKRIDSVFNLDEDTGIKCCATFGKTVSKYQIAKLHEKGIFNIVLLFDPDAVTEIKKFSFDLQTYFNVSIGVFEEEEDIDDISSDRVEEILQDLKTPFQYFSNRIGKRKLVKK